MTSELSMTSELIANHSQSSASIDHSLLHILEEDVADNDANIMLELIDIFIHDSANNIRCIAQAVEQKEFRKLEISAHSLKSSSATFGATILSSLCAHIEQIARAKTVEGVEEVLNSIRDEFARVEAILRVEREKWAKVASP